MADLKLRRDRGQIILIAAFALAVIFLGFAVLTNSAIFTENLASRGETTGSDDALVMRAMAEENIGQSIETANYYNYSSDPLDAFNDSLENVSTQTEYMSASSGILVNVTYVDHRDGTRINESVGNGDVATGVDRVSGHNGTREFRINATSLPSTTQDPLTITANASGNDRWKTFIQEDGSDVIVKTNRTTPSGFETEECRVQATDPYQIDVTSGRINGTPCSALRRNSTTGINYWFSAGAGSTYDIEFENASSPNTEANYSVVVHGSPSSGLDALYDVTTRFTYDGTDITYNTTMRVAPGEPDA